MNINTRTPALPVDAEIALHLATLAHHLPSSDAPSRESLWHIADLLHGVNPNIEAAASVALLGASADATSCDPLALQPDAWLLRGCARLLLAAAESASAVAAPAVTLPTAAELSAWSAALAAIDEGLIGEGAPTSDAGPARSLQLSTLRLWLSACEYARIHADAGLSFGAGADGLPPL
ncbi:MAG: hypothetical protein ABI671_16025 [Burkholderiales bacterium]